MADIDIERRGAPVWIWWILGLILLGFLLLWLLTPTRERVAEVEPAAPILTEEVTTEPLRPAAVEQYLVQCAPREPGEMGVEHEYTSNCIRRLVTRSVRRSPTST
jgi:hypothetical protein